MSVCGVMVGLSVGSLVGMGEVTARLRDGSLGSGLNIGEIPMVPP
jgi:hypothetical protein